MTEASAHRPLLSAQSLGVQLGGTPILRGVNLEVHRGEVLGVFGPSGAGKSTLFRALMGEERPSSGRVFCDGKDVTALPLWRRARLGMGYLPQGPSVLWDLSVDENLAVFTDLAPQRSPSAPPPDIILSQLGLGDRKKLRASSLSGGERRRLELARALIGDPRVLLCDEPFAAVDPHGVATIASVLRDLASRGVGVVIADHHVNEALGICQRAALLVEGELAVTRRPDEFFSDPLVRKHYLRP